MNRRAFLASLLAAPVVASLPDIRRPTFAGMFHRATVLRARDAVISITDGATAYELALGKTTRLAQNAIDVARAISEALAAGMSPGEALPIAVHYHCRAIDIMLESPPSAAGVRVVEVFAWDDVRPVSRLRVAIRPATPPSPAAPQDSAPSARR